MMQDGFLVLKLVLLLVLIAFLFSNCHYVRAIMRPAKDTDYKSKFVNHVNTGQQSFNFTEQLDMSIGDVSFQHQGESMTLADFLVSTKTQSFLFIKDDEILYEYFAKDYSDANMISTWSLTKIVVSSLVDIAIQESYLESVHEPIIKYVPELEGQVYESVTFHHLLNMKSGINYTADEFEVGPYLHVHYDPDLMKYLCTAESVVAPGTRVRYSQIDLIILGVALRRAINRPLSTYLEEKIWTKIGTEHNAYWATDKTDSRIERTASGFFASSIDLAKIGRLYLNNGRFEGEQIISEEWAKMSVRDNGDCPKCHITNLWRHSLVTTVETEQNPLYIPDDLIERRYGDAYSNGANNNKLIYLLPEENIIIVRFGKGMRNKEISDGMKNFTAEFLAQ